MYTHQCTWIHCIMWCKSVQLCVQLWLWYHSALACCMLCVVETGSGFLPLQKMEEAHKHRALTSCSIAVRLFLSLSPPLPCSLPLLSFSSQPFTTSLLIPPPPSLSFCLLPSLPLSLLFYLHPLSHSPSCFISLLLRYPPPLPPLLLFL